MEYIKNTLKPIYQYTLYIFLFSLISLIYFFIKQTKLGFDTQRTLETHKNIGIYLSIHKNYLVSSAKGFLPSSYILFIGYYNMCTCCKYRRIAGMGQHSQRAVGQGISHSLYLSTSLPTSLSTSLSSLSLPLSLRLLGLCFGQ